MKRRSFLRVTLLSAAAAPLPMVGCSNGDGPPMPPFMPDEDELEAAEVLRAYLCDDGAAVDAAKRVGTAYLARFDDEDAAHADLQAVVERVGGAENADAAVAMLEADVQTDFEELRIASVAGWTLSETEARICGVLAVSG